jgi:hypothetical protein
VSTIVKNMVSFAVLLLCLSAVGLAGHGEPNNHGQLQRTKACTFVMLTCKNDLICSFYLRIPAFKLVSLQLQLVCCSSAWCSLACFTS